MLALVTEGGWAGEGSRVVFLLAFGLALATGAVLLLRAGDARKDRETAAPERALRQAREQQTATGEILRVIFQLADGAPIRLQCDRRERCEALRGKVWGSLPGPGWRDSLRRPPSLHARGAGGIPEAYPMPVAQGQGITAEGIRRGRVVHVADIEDDPGVAAVTRQLARTLGYRSSLVVPMLRAGQCIGSLGISRSDARGGPRPFTDREIGLIQTFADQAVVAIENVRLFQELEAQRGPGAEPETLEQQTATARDPACHLPAHRRISSRPWRRWQRARPVSASRPMPSCSASTETSSARPPSTERSGPCPTR